MPPPKSARERTLALLAKDRHPAEQQLERGWIELLGDEDPTGAHPGQQLMLSNALPLIYERLWRPLGSRVLMGLAGPDAREEHRLALEMLALTPKDRVLDVACGPGNFTRSFAPAVSEGLVVGLDASKTMLARARKETREEDNIAYVRGDACALPFRSATFHAVCCFAALYLIEDPLSALDEIVRVLAPGGRVALLASCNRGVLPASVHDPVVRRLTGVRIFARAELTEGLRARGLTDVQQRVTGLVQFVSARKPK